MSIENTIEPQSIDVNRQYPLAITERVQDWAHRVLREGYTLGLEEVGLLQKQLIYDAVDAYSFYNKVTAVYQKAYKALLKCKGILQDTSIPLTSTAVEQELVKKYLDTLPEVEAFTFMFNQQEMWNLLQLEKEPVKIRILLDELKELLQQGFDGWVSSGELAPTLQWKEGPSTRKQVLQLFTALKAHGFLHPKTSSKLFLLLFISNKAPYKVVWMHRGLPSLIYLAEKLLQADLLTAPEQVLSAAKQKKALALDAVVMPWLFERICSGFAYINLKGSLKHITHGMLIDARYRAESNNEKRNSLPPWSLKLDKIIKQVLKTN